MEKANISLIAFERKTIEYLMYRVRIGIISICLLLMGYVANAQLNGTHLLGDAGLQSGSQLSPSFTLFVPVYNYHASHFITANDNKINIPNINMFLTGVGGSIVTHAKILGGNYGATVLIPFASSKIEGGDISMKSSIALSDIYIQPFQLGWQTMRADFTLGYAITIPTGKYELGGDNAGLGMLTNEFSGGATLYLDSKKEWSFSTLLSYGINSEKKNTGSNNVIKVGNNLSAEGGLGKTWSKSVKNSDLPLVIGAGMVYYMQFKTTDDKIKVSEVMDNAFNFEQRDRSYALGAEANVFIPAIKSSISVRWLGELGSRNRTQGNTFFITWAPYIKFL